jgi:hypothetical protein
MVSVIDAKDAIGKVKETLQWVDKQTIPRSDGDATIQRLCIVPQGSCTFGTNLVRSGTNFCSHTEYVVLALQLLFTDTVENMTLNKYLMSGEEIEGVRLLEFRGTEWLGSTGLRAGLIMLSRRYVSDAVGFFTPD